MIVVSLCLLTYIPLALLSFPLNDSPINKSPVLAFGLLILVNDNLGNKGALVFLDSNIPYTLVTSGVFKEISSSWTLVP